MVEQRTENPRVPSSILGLGTSNYYRQPVAEQTCITPAEVAEWSTRQSQKLLRGNSRVGSSPTFGTIEV
jgi:hypothetical protein